MKLLLDSHALIWAVDDPAKLGSDAFKAVEQPGNELLLGTGAIWEIAIKVSLSKLKLTLPYGQWISRAVSDLNIAILPITIEHTDILTTLPNHHRDPFDRLLISQAIAEKIMLVSADSMFDKYGVQRVW